MGLHALSAQRLITAAELTGLAGVQRATVTNWQRRHRENFPEPATTGNPQTYRLDEILGWLERRRIPADSRLSHESVGTTYADRVRRRITAVGDTRRVPTAGRPKQATSTGRNTTTKELLARAARITDDVVTAVQLCLLLAYLHDHDGPDAMNRFQRKAEKDPRAALHALINRVDRALRLNGVPGVPLERDRFDRLRPTPRDLGEIVQRCGDLPQHEYDQLFIEHERAASLDSTRFSTPECLSSLIARLVLPGEGAPRGVFDPFARTGELLTAVHNALPSGAPLPALRANVRDSEAARLTGMRLAHHRLPADIRSEGLRPWQSPSRGEADVIVTNPPFNLPGLIDRDTQREWEFGLPPSGNLNYGWLQYALGHLSEVGRAAIILPTSANASAHPRERAIRKRMIDIGTVEAIITLPSELFAFAGAAVSIWLLRRPTAGSPPILMIDARKAQRKIATKQRVVPESDRDSIVSTLTTWRTNPNTPFDVSGGTVRAASVSPDTIRDLQFSLNPPDYLRDGTHTQTPEQRAESLTSAIRETEQCLIASLQIDDRVAGLALHELPVVGDPIPSGWHRITLNELCTIQNGPAGSRLAQAAQTEHGEIPVVAPKHLAHRRIVGPSDKLLPLDRAEALRRHRLRSGDILCGRSGKTGITALVTRSEEGWVFNTNLLRLHEFAATVDPRYLLAYLSMPVVESWLTDLSTSTVPSVRADSLGQLPVVLPPLDEQRRIGGTFAAFDDQIRAHRALVDASTRNRAALADHLFGDVLSSKSHA